MSRLIDWKTVCLVCLKKCENRSIFERDTETNLIADKIMKCGDIFIENETDQPKSICLQCLDNLNVTYKFHRNYEQSDSIIKAVLGTNHKEFPIKDLWKTAPFRGAPQKESPQKEILHIEESANSDEIDIKHEINENDVVDDTHDNDTSPSIDLEDNIDTEAKLVKHPAEACFEGTAIELNELKANEGNKICGICNRAYKHIKIHMKRHKNERPFSCGLCDKAYVSSPELRRHMRLHTGEKPYECEYCDRRFHDNSNRKSHERTHTGEKPFVCPTCGKTFAHSQSLSQHRRIHSDVKKFMCEQCGKGFNGRKSLESHVRLHLSRDKLDKSSEHKQKKVLEKEILQIEECAQSNEINIKHEIIEHDVVDDAHDNDTSPYIDLEDNIDTAAKLVLKDPAEACFQDSAIELNDLKANEGNKICGICNRAYKHLKDHMKRHNKERPFSCDLCDKAFVSSGELRIHMRVHTSEKPYECQYCDRRFAQRCHRQIHERTHTGEKPYKCQYCDRRFPDNSHRKCHERTHTGEHPFVCPTCGKTFSHSASLSQHRRIHSDVKKFMCEQCGKGFNRKESLEGHVRRHLSRDKLDKSSEHKQKKVREMETPQIEECAKSSEINIKHDIIDNYVVGDINDNDTSPCIDLRNNISTKAKLILKALREACF